MQEGYSAGLQEREGDPKHILVVKLPNPDACPDCERLHLTAGRGSPPRLFPLSELKANGTNFGLKRNAWKAVVGTVHPWCACELLHVPPGLGYERKPPTGEHWQAVPKRKGAYRRRRGDEWEYWRPRMVAESMRRGLALRRDLMKSLMTYGDSVPEHGVVLRIGDPLMRQAVERVIAQSPKQLFSKMTGVTLITTDIPRPGVALNEHDLAYWTGNEIRLSQTLPYDKVDKVIKHELGHVLNVYLINKWGGEAPVVAWHKKLFAAGEDEGHVSAYAATLPIECAAETTRLYLYDRTRLMLNYPKQFSILHEAYRELLHPVAALPEGLKKAMFIGPRGGKWADAKHTIPWKESNSHGLPLHADGTVTVYHHTSKASAASIRQSGQLRSKGEPHVYVTTHRELDTGYGDTVVAIRVDPKHLSLDDEFPSGRKDFALSLDRPGGSRTVTVEKP
jgi:hypothetical protein